MIVTIVIALILWFVAPLLIESRVTRKNDRKAYQLLCRILSIAIIAWVLFKQFI